LPKPGRWRPTSGSFVGTGGGIVVTTHQSVIGGVSQGGLTGGTIGVLGEKFSRKAGFSPTQMGVRKRVLRMRGPRKATTIP